jgi:hypothetical protein
MTSAGFKRTWRRGAMWAKGNSHVISLPESLDLFPEITIALLQNRYARFQIFKYVHGFGWTPEKRSDLG